MSVTISGTAGVTFNDASNQTTAATGFGFKNRIINGGMVIDQRNAGASVTAINGAYTVDRWLCTVSQSSKFTAQQNAGAVTPPAGFINYLGCTSSSAYSVTSTDYLGINQRIEGFNIADFGWGAAGAATVTLSFWVRSSLTGTFGGSIMNSGFNRSYPFSYTISAANTWEQKSITIAGDTSGTWLTTNGVGARVLFSLGCGSTRLGTAGSWTGSSDIFSAIGETSVVGTNGATFYITGVQLEKGSTATSFDYRPYGTELALCQRYFFRKNAGAIGDAIAQLQTFSTSGCFGKLIDLPVTMRANPVGSVSSITHFSPTTAGGGGGAAFSGGAIDYVSPTALGTTAFTGSSGLVAGNATTITANNASLWIAASAEL